MRDLLFKNLTSTDKKRKIISTSEVVDKEGIHSVIHRHFICMLKEVEGNKVSQPAPSVYVIKEHNTKEQKEKFFCKIKGSMYAMNDKKLFLIFFVHSLKINLIPSTQNLN